MAFVRWFRSLSVDVQVAIVAVLGVVCLVAWPVAMVAASGSMTAAMPQAIRPRPSSRNRIPRDRCEERSSGLAWGSGAVMSGDQARDRASRMRTQERIPLWKLRRSYFSFGLWMRSSSSAKPARITSMPSADLS